MLKNIFFFVKNKFKFSKVQNYQPINGRWSCIYSKNIIDRRIDFNNMDHSFCNKKNIETDDITIIIGSYNNYPNNE